MPSERWRSSSDIFNAALQRAPDERTEFVAQACGEDETLRRRVELLLKYNDGAQDFIEAPAYEAAPDLLGGDPEELLGQHLGPYRIDAVLGIGGMGVVYLACDERLGRKVGLKLVPPSLVADAAQLERLKREARTASSLNHPNIVTIHEIGEVDGAHYIATEYIEGITLRERIAQAPLSPNEALDIAIQLASALSVAHRAGIVHRDIKPENIMLRSDGYVKILDFGIAKFTAHDVGLPVTAASANVTMPGIILGTTRYMSPEQSRGQTLDAGTDIWSLGVVLYEMLTAHPPFDGATTTDVMAAVLLSEPAPVEQGAAIVPMALRRVVEKALRKNPAERFQTADEMLAELHAVKEQPARTRKPHAIALAAAVTLLASALMYVALSRHDSAVAQHANGVSRLNGPTGLAVTPAGDIFVADVGTHTIFRITSAGAVRVFAGVVGSAGTLDGRDERARFYRPADVAVDPRGDFYIADTDNNTIRKITPSGVVSTIAGVAGVRGSEDGPALSARFRYPTGIAVDDGGEIYVADFHNHVIRKITTEGHVITLAGSAENAGSADGNRSSARFNLPHEVAVDRARNVYVADFGNHTIRRITPDGDVTTLAGHAGEAGSSDGAAEQARFHSPYGVAVDDDGNVYVADTSNHTIRKIAPDGVVSTLAGAQGEAGQVDGALSNARFNVPTAVAVDSARNVYVADYGNHAVREITADGAVRTVAVGR